MQPMPRLLLVLIPLLLLLGLPADLLAADHGAVVEAAEACHCCPDEVDAQGDCCDRDLGACCAVSLAALAGIDAPSLAEPAAAPPELESAWPVHLWRPRDNGPPPTPPPIG